MSIPLRSWLYGIFGMVIGCTLFAIDTYIEIIGPSFYNVHLWMETVEFLMIGPGLGVTCLLIAERLRTLREAADLQKSAERERRFIMLGRMAASVAHEVRNPLHTLRLVVDELRVEQPGLSANPLSAHIDQSLERIDRAVDLVYQLARPGAEDGSVGDLIVALQEARTNLDRRHTDHRVEAHDLPARAVVRCTPSGLRIMLDNLLRNATEASPTGSLIEVTVRSQHDNWIITITNPGALPADLPAVGSAVMHDSSKATGLGLGLLITRHLAGNAGGSLELTSADGTVSARLTLPTWEGIAS